MNAPFENRNRVAGVEEFGRRWPHEGVTTQSKDDILARLEPLVAQRVGSCESVGEPQGPLPLRARQKGEGPRDRASRDKLEAFLRTDCAAIEAEVGVKNARPHTPRAESWKAATSNAFSDPTDELQASRHQARTLASDPVGVVDRRAVHDRPRRDRGLLAAVGALISQAPSAVRPALFMGAGGT